MYLSRLSLNPRHPLARRDLADAYEMHRTLVRAFAPNPGGRPHRFLWRLERRDNFQLSSVVLVQAEQPADWSVLAAGYANDISGNKLVDLSKFIQAGKRYRFRLLANPTVTRGGKRYGLTRVEDQLAWLVRQGQRQGFSLLGCQRGANERLQTRQGRTGNRITIHTALFEGVLEAVSADSLRQGVLKGFGHGKALGLGLLSLARVS